MKVGREGEVPPIAGRRRAARLREYARHRKPALLSGRTRSTAAERKKTPNARLKKAAFHCGFSLPRLRPRGPRAISSRMLRIFLADVGPVRSAPTIYGNGNNAYALSTNLLILEAVKPGPSGRVCFWDGFCTLFDMVLGDAPSTQRNIRSRNSDCSTSCGAFLETSSRKTLALAPAPRPS